MVFVWRDYCFASEDLTGMAMLILNLKIQSNIACVHHSCSLQLSKRERRVDDETTQASKQHTAKRIRTHRIGTFGAQICCLMVHTISQRISFSKVSFVVLAYLHNVYGKGALSIEKYYGKGVIQNCQHYQERTQSTLLCDPFPPYSNSTLKMLISRPLLQIAM